MNRMRSQERSHVLHASLWLVPVASMAAAMLAGPVMRWIDEQTRWTVLSLGLEGAKAIVGGLASSLLTFIVFTISILLLATQMASQTMSPRMIARLFEYKRTKVTLGAFVFAWTYSIGIVGRIEGRVPQLSVALAIFMSIAGVGLFFYLVQVAVKGLRPGAILIGVAADTWSVIDAVYPTPYQADQPARVATKLGPLARSVAWRGRSGMFVAFDAMGIVEIAARAGCLISLAPQIGDFLASGDDLFRLHGSAVGQLDEQTLGACVAVAPERRLGQDPMFGLRIIVDVASRALSPAINDPTTAVLAIDQLQHLLKLLAQRELDDGVWRDAAGTPRLVYRTPDWEDFVTLAVTEPRVYGAPNPQVTRRLEALFEHVMQSAPAGRIAVLEAQRELLRQTIARNYEGAGDRAIAGQADLQGFGSSQREGATAQP